MEECVWLMMDEESSIPRTRISSAGSCIAASSRGKKKEKENEEESQLLLFMYGDDFCISSLFDPFFELV